MAKRATRWIVGIAAAAAWLLPGAVARADDDGWGDPRAERLAAEVAALEAAARGETPARLPTPGRAPAATDVAFQHGNARFFADLARVDVTLEIGNPTSSPIEWARTFALDPSAEVLGAVLERAGAPAVACRTLPLEDARRIDREARTPRTVPTLPPGRDPLRVERPEAGRLDIVVWPVAPQERVRVRLTLVTALGGHGRQRVYVDPLRAVAPGDDAPGGPEAPVEGEVVVRPGDLSLASASADLVLAGRAGDALRFAEATPSGAAGPGRLTFTAAPREAGALALRGGGLGARVVLWRLDPAAVLEAHGIRPEPCAEIRFAGVLGSTSRLSVDRWDAAGEATVLAARLAPGATALRLAAEVWAGGRRTHAFAVEEPVRRADLDPALEEASTGYHRARLARRAIALSEGNPAWRRQALGYAVDAGVLVPGTAALALPRAEQRLLPRESRRQYLREGTTLGGGDGEADWASPPTFLR